MSKYPGRIVTDLAPAGYSVFFDGTGDWIQAPSNAAFSPGTGDFTIECWTYLTAVTGEGTLFYINAANGINLFLNISSNWGIGRAGVAVDNNFGTPPALNIWNHLAVSRSGTTIRAFINGAQVFSGSNSSNYAQGAALIGSSNSFGTVTGFVSNFRLIKGTALYTAAFTPPTQLFPITNTSLLTCQSPTIIDNSSNAFAITANGNAAVSPFTPFTAYVPYNPALGAATPGIWTVDEAMQAAATRQWNMYDPNFPNTTLLLHGNPTNGTSFITDASTNNFTVTPLATPRAANLSPFSLTTFATSGSGYFNGANSDAVEIANNAAFDFGTGDVTVEAWVNLASTSAIQNLIDCGPSSGSGFTSWTLDITASGFIRFNSYVGGTYQAIEATSNALATNQWYHIAFTRSSGTNRLFVNGAVCTTTGTLTQAINSGGNTVLIGRGKYSGFTRPTTGYFSNVRIVKGVGVYTGAFTTPTAPLTATQAAGTNISAITGTQTSLLTLQNSQSANNNAFLDSSPNNFLVTRFGNTTQGTFTPFSQTGWSNYFDGSTNGFINVLDAGSVLDLPGDFTVEFWSYQNAIATLNGTLNLMMSVDTLDRFQIYQDGSIIACIINGATVISTSTRPSLNSWNHLAFVRSGTTVTFYLNGVAITSGTSSFSIACASLTIGGQNRTGAASPSVVYHGYNGYISNFRLVKGTAVYTGAFTPSASPLTAISGTSLLTCNSNRFADVSSNALSVSPIGTTATVQAFSPFYPTAAYTPQTIGGSGFFDGSSDYLAAAGNAAFVFGTGDFTLETWIYPNSISTGTFDRVCATSDFNGSGFDWALNSGSSALYLASSSYGFTINPRSWNHIVYTRSGTTLRGFLNGRLASYNTGVSQNITSATALQIGQGYSGTGFNGYMTDLRIIKGSIPTAYQTSSTTTGTQIFTSPTAPLTTTSQGATSGNVSFLLNYTNAGVIDSTGDTVFETTGSAQITTALSRFGGSSIYFDGTGDALFIPPNQKENLRFGTGDFTIEFWAWKSANGSTGFDGVISVTPDGTFNGGFGVELSSNRGFCFLYDSAIRVQSNFNPNDSTWHHYAVVRNGGTIFLYRDGVVLSSAALTPNLGVAGNAYIGGVSSATANNFNGYIDELRVTKGVARYTGTFTPQTSQWQDQ